MQIIKSFADGLTVINATNSAVPGHSNVQLAGSMLPGQVHVIENMPDEDVANMVAIAEHPDGEPMGMDVEAAYARLEPLLAGCPDELRPIP
jgi:hypothetical protein